MAKYFGEGDSDMKFLGGGGSQCASPLYETLLTLFYCSGDSPGCLKGLNEVLMLLAPVQFLLSSLCFL